MMHYYSAPRLKSTIFSIVSQKYDIQRKLHHFFWRNTPNVNQPYKNARQRFTYLLNRLDAWNLFINMIFLYCPSITWFFISVKGMVVFVSLWTCDGKSGDPGVAVFGRGCCSNIHLSVVVVVVGFTYLLLSFHYRDYTRFLCVSVSLRE